ncbi:MAG: NAD synthetase [Alphaproteobacteria bacterium 13_1_20CM_4_65_11]|nr:MAG: NAD synthetase [Alphaproteobacteria bacterium 13_1_20CM_4_65_11]
MSESLSALLYLVAAICFIMALRGLSSPETARGGNIFGIVGMVIAILTTLASPEVVSYWLIVIGIVIGGAVGAYIARQIQMTALPQLVAAFHSLVGLAAVCVAAAAFAAPEAYGIGIRGAIHPASLVEMAIGLTIGAITFTGSIVAFAKLQGLVSGRPLTFAGQHPINLALGILLIALIVLFVMTESSGLFLLLVLLSLAFGFLLIVPIGGADMPVVISMLNSYSGWAACGIGFTLSNSLLIITGALVGSSGAILSYIMCKGMNRSIINVILGGFGTEGGAAPAGAGAGDRLVKSGSAEDAAFILKNAGSVIIVPGYEANVPYDEVFELDEINRDFASTDVAFVIGANDVTNPAAKTDPTSPIYGMPILDVERAKTVLFVKRSMASGYAGVENELFYRDNTMMLFGDAKKMCEEIVKALE